MKKSLHAIIFVLAGMFLSMGSFVLQAQIDDPNIDRIPDDFIQHQQNNNNRNPSTVITIDTGGLCEFKERSFDAAGQCTATVRESFSLQID